MNHHENLAQQICESGRRLYEQGLIAATEGNISARLTDDRVLCTPTMISKGYMKPADLCVVDPQGNQVAGDKPPTSEIRLHLTLYNSNPHTGAVIHCHPPHTTAFAISRMTLPTGLPAGDYVVDVEIRDATGNLVSTDEDVYTKATEAAGSLAGLDQVTVEWTEGPPGNGSR